MIKITNAYLIKMINVFYAYLVFMSVYTMIHFALSLQKLRTNHKTKHIKIWNLVPEKILRMLKCKKS